MKKIFITLLTLILIRSITNAQTIPVGYCGIQYSYDAAGNRTEREYVCNNGFAAITNSAAAAEFADKLAPNPTTGKFSVIFSKALQNADITIADATGRTVMQMKGKGNKIDFDISPLAAGVYFLRVTDENRMFEKKIVKQ